MKPIPPDGLEDLRTLVKRGDLFAVQDWIAAGKPIFVDESRKKNVLAIAVDKGFLAMVDVLASSWPDKTGLNSALQRAACNRRADLVWLLLNRGADITSVHLYSIADCCDKDLLRHFLDRWDIVGGKNGLVEIVAAMPRPLTGLIREYAKKIPDYEGQLSQALCWFVEEDHPRWIGLSLWMGANPRLRVPNSLIGEDEPEEWMSSIEMAVFEGNLQALKLMKPSADKDDLTALLQQVWRPECVEAGEYLLSLGANINDKPNGGSYTLDRLLTTQLEWKSYGFDRVFGWREQDAMKRWIDHGARFVPDDKYGFREARSCAYVLSDYEIEPFMKTLLKAAEPEVVFKLFDTQKLRKKLGLTSKQLREKIEKLVKKKEPKVKKPKEVFVDPPEGVFRQHRPNIGVPQRVVISRADLYVKVWSTPVLQLAREYGISDVGLAKVCKSYEIPRPGLGYWAKREHGHRVKRERLRKKDWNPEIHFCGYSGPVQIADAAMAERVAAMRERLSRKNLMVEVKDSGPVHRLLEKNGQEDEGKGDKRWWRVLNALLHFLEAQGFQLEVEAEEDRFTAGMFGQTVSFGLLRVNDRLSLEIYGPEYGLRTSWRDGARGYIENRFAKLGCTLAYLAALATGATRNKRQTRKKTYKLELT